MYDGMSKIVLFHCELWLSTFVEKSGEKRVEKKILTGKAYRVYDVLTFPGRSAPAIISG